MTVQDERPASGDETHGRHPPVRRTHRHAHRTAAQHRRCHIRSSRQPTETGLSPQRRAEVQRAVRDHLLLHFTDWPLRRRRGRRRSSSAATAATSSTTTGRRVIDGLSGLFCTNLGHSYGAEIGAAGAAQLGRARLHPVVGTSPTRRPPTSSARLAEKAAPLGLHPGLPDLRRRRGGRERLEAGPAVARRQRRAPAPQGDRSPGGLPRHVTWGRCRSPASPSAASRSSRSASRPTT